jgi:hypothetical protein
MNPEQPPSPATNGEWLEKLEHLQHWWREPIAGLIAVFIGCFDIWHYGTQAGFSSSLDEILMLTGIALIAGIRNLFGGNNKPPPKPPG